MGERKSIMETSIKDKLKQLNKDTELATEQLHYMLTEEKFLPDTVLWIAEKYKFTAKKLEVLVNEHKNNTKFSITIK